MNGQPICINSKGGRDGVEGLQPSIKDRVYLTQGVSCALATANFFNPGYLTEKEGGQKVKEYRIRKLTEIECLRLMGVSDEDAYKMRAVNSASQIYKQAGNSIVVDVMAAIFDNLFNKKDEMPGQMTIFDYL